LRVQKNSWNYLRKEIRKNLFLMIVCIVVLVLMSFTNVPGLPIMVNWGVFTNYFAVAFALLGLGFVRFYRRYANYRNGFEGEKRVAKYLESNFSDDYYLINDVVYVNDRGYKQNIDHVVLGPNGIFVIETKDYKGKIKVKQSSILPFQFGRSPIGQAQGNAVWIKGLIDKSGILGDFKLWIKPILVFSNPTVEIDTISPEIETIELEKLSSSIKEYANGYNFSNTNLKAIRDKILENAVET